MSYAKNMEEDDVWMYVNEAEVYDHYVVNLFY
jgi:hypothetical protein